VKPGSYNSYFSCIYCAFQKHANSEVQKPIGVCVFAAVNHLSGPLRKQKFTSTGSKGHGLLFVAGGVCFCVTRFVACDRNCD